MPDFYTEAIGLPANEVAPATTAVSQQIRIHLRNLTSTRDLVRNTRDGDQPLISTVEEVNAHDCLAAKVTDFPQLSHDKKPSSQELLQSAQKAREWLLQIVSIQSDYDRAHFVRLFRSTLETDPCQWTDMQHLYYILTDPKTGETTHRLRVAFAVCLRRGFADKCTLELARAQQAVYLKDLRHSSHITPAILAARNKVADKAKSSKIDSFVCAVPLSTIHASTCDSENECPICRESFTDLTTNTIQDLLADYPVRIKYCGHVVGKSCLEMWWDTPNKDPAKYPFKTCPLCRTEISGREGEEPELSVDLGHRLRYSRFVERVRETTGMDDDDVEVGVKRVMSEEIAVLEMRVEVDRVKRIRGVEEEVVMRADRVLKDRFEETMAERGVWRIPNYLWDAARRDWMEAV